MTAEPIPTTPQSIDAERSILAAMILDPESAQHVARSEPPLIRRQDFHRTSHQHFFDAILAITDSGRKADLIQIAHELAARGQLDLVGGPAAVASLMEFSASPANLDHYCGIVRESAARRRTIALADSIAVSARDPGVNLSDLLVRIGQQAPEIASGIAVTQPVTLLEQVETVEEAIERGVPPVSSLIGNGLVTRGGITLVASLPKFGKTFFAMQAQVALAMGAPLLGFQCAEARSLMLQLEMPRAGILDRLRAVTHQTRGRIDLLVQPSGWDSITSPRTLDQLCRTIERRRVDLVVADPVRALHTSDENDGRDQGAVMDAIRAICNRTGCAFVMLHHVNKMKLEKGDDLRTAVLLSVRGSTRYISDADTILGLVRVHGQTRLVFAGARFGSFPESIAIKQDESGWFSVVDTPEQRRDETEEAVEKFLMASGASGMTVRDLMRATLKSEGTVRKALASIRVVSAKEPGRSGAVRFFLAGCEPSEQEEMGAGDGDDEGEF